MYKKDVKIHYELKYEPREIQKDALEFTKKQIRHGKKYIMLNMPTGSGKSFFSVMFMNWYKNYINKEAKFDILTNTKILQDQYVNEFPFMANLKGKNSYKCNSYPNSSCEEGKQMNKALKRTCTDCPYDKDLNKWRSNDVSITNFHLFDTMCLFLPEMIEAKEPNVLIIDEAHDFEAVLCDYISLKISKRSLKMMGFSDVNIIGISHDLKTRVTTLNEFVDYLNDTFITKLKTKESALENRLINPTLPSGDKIKASKNLTTLKATITNYESFLEKYDDNSTNWVMDIEFNSKEPQFKNEYTIQPVWSNDYLKEIIWDKYDHVLLMSGTILNKDIFSYISGIETKKSAYYEVDSPYNIKNRPIYYLKVGKMTYHEKVKTFEKQKGYIDKILKKNKNNKGIIHCGTYEISDWLKEYYKDNDRLLFHTSDTRTEVLNEHLTSIKPTVLVSPSMITGIDLKSELSRFQIIIKIPYPNIKSKKIKQRQLDNKDWYAWKTVLDLIQSYGRSIRSEDDWAETYVLDSSFSNIMQYNHKFLPKYFTDAIKLIKI